MKKNKLGQRKLQVAFEPGVLAPDEESVKFRDHLFIIKRFCKLSEVSYHIWVKEEPSICIIGDALKEQLILNLIEKHPAFFSLKEQPSKAKFTTQRLSSTASATDPSWSSSNQVLVIPSESATGTDSTWHISL